MAEVVSLSKCRASLDELLRLKAQRNAIRLDMTLSDEERAAQAMANARRIREVEDQLSADANAVWREQGRREEKRARRWMMIPAALAVALAAAFITLIFWR